MNIIKRYEIKSQSSLIFAKRDLKNYFKHLNLPADDFIFALMELGTNILKYAKEGEIWLLEEKGKHALCALDKGPGIENLDWALKKGTTSAKNSLGLGLFQLSIRESFNLEIFSKKNLGTVVVFHNIPDLEYVYLSLPLIDNKSGDFFAKKGRFFLFGDAAGHGNQALKTAEYVKKRFFEELFSCTFIDEFFKQVHIELKQKKLRGCVVDIVEVSKKYFNICGVGNIMIFYNSNMFSQKEGIIGVAFSSSTKITFERPAKLTLCSDGIDVRVIKDIIEDINSPILLSVAGIYFSNKHDDKSILTIWR